MNFAASQENGHRKGSTTFEITMCLFEKFREDSLRKAAEVRSTSRRKMPKTRVSDLTTPPSTAGTIADLWNSWT